jgi:hypothetical protein
VPALTTGKDVCGPGLKGLWKQAHVNLTTYAGDSGNELSRNDARYLEHNVFLTAIPPFSF